MSAHDHATAGGCGRCSSPARLDALRLLVFGIGAWGAVARISGAVVAAGALEVEGNRQVVQHPTGGVIEAIHARDGDEVEAGEVLIELDGEDLRPRARHRRGPVVRDAGDARAGSAAERDGLDDDRVRSGAGRARGDPPRSAQLMAAQQAAVRRPPQAQGEEEQQLDEQQTQIAKQNEGLEALQAATRSQIELLSRRRSRGSRRCSTRA